MNPSSETDLFSHAGNWLMGAARRNPEGLLLLAAGCALVMRSGRGSSGGNHHRSSLGEASRNIPNMSGASSGPNMSGASSGLRKGLSDTAEMATDYASDLKDRASDAAGSYVDSVSEFAGDARRAVSEGSDRIRRQAQGALQTTMDRVLRDQPLAVAMLGVAAGAAVAAAFPATDMENRVLGGTHEALSNAVDQAGKSVMGAASKAGERLKTAAEEHGFTSQGVKDFASEVAESFTDAVAGKADAKADAKSSATSGSGGSGLASGGNRLGGASAGGSSSGGANGGKGDASKTSTTSWPNSGGTR